MAMGLSVGLDLERPEAGAEIAHDVEGVFHAAAQRVAGASAAASGSLFETSPAWSRSLRKAWGRRRG